MCVYNSYRRKKNNEIDIKGIDVKNKGVLSLILKLLSENYFL